MREGDRSAEPSGDGAADTDGAESEGVRSRSRSRPRSGSETKDDRDAEAEPLGDLAADVRRRRRGEGDGAGIGDGSGGADDFFEAVDVGTVDPGEVWADLFPDEGALEPVNGADGGAGDSVCPGDGNSVGPDDAAVEESADGAERVIKKRSFCQRCPHFAAPPGATCGHGAAEIVEVVDFDRFRVRGCPMVAEYGGEGGVGSIPRSDNP